MRIALAIVASSALLCSVVWAADTRAAGPGPKPNKISEKMASMVIQPSVVRSAKMKDRAMLQADKMEQGQAVAEPGLKKVGVDKKPVKMNKIDDRSNKMMLKAPVARKMKAEIPQYADRIQAMQLGVK